MKDKDSVILVSDKGKSHFALPILNSISKKMKSYHSESKHNIIHRIRSRNKKIVWVEWARQESIYMSKIIKKNQKLFIRLHRYEIEDLDTMNKINWDNVNAIIFVNSDLEQNFKNKICNSVNTITIPNALKISNFEKTIITSKNSLLAYGVQFQPRKGYYKLIKLFKKIIEQDSSFHLTIGGQSPVKEVHQKYYNECKDLINYYDLNNNISLKKFTFNKNELTTHSNIITLLKNHNGIISYSENESFHYSFAEGLLCGLEGFCNRWGELSLDEFWKDWSYDDENDFIEGILDWGKKSLEERKKIAINNRKYIIDNFSTESISERYIDLFLSENQN